MNALSKKKLEMASVLPGFEEINRFWDHRNNVSVAKILPGEYYVTTNDEVIATVLGSCISVCVRDPMSGIGGMNHFMLPEDNSGEGTWGKTNVNKATRYGTYAMEHMINDIFKYGGNRNRFEIKICGGGRILKMMSDVGGKNIRFIKNYLCTEGFEIVSEDVGDIYPRKVRYYPKTGKMMIKKLETLHNDTIIKREENYRHDLVEKPVAGDVELF
jgi:chemotaxis protein CheD